MKVIVKYINEKGEELKEIVTVEKDGRIEQEEKDSTEEIEGLEGDAYETEAKEFKGYTLKEEPSNARGEMISTEENTIYVTYYYEKTKVTIKVKYVNAITGELVEKLKVKSE